MFLATYFIGSNLTEAENIQDGWRQMFWSELIPSALFLALLFIVPKSPRWLALKGRNDEAIEVLKRIHGKDNLEEEKEAVLAIPAEKNGTSKVRVNNIASCQWVLF